MDKQTRDLLTSLLKEPKWRSELPLVCPVCCGVKFSRESRCGNCVDSAMARLRPDPRQDSYQCDGFSVGNSPTQISRTVHYTDKDGRHRVFQKEIE